MLEIVKKELNISIISSIIYAILGIVIVANPEVTLSVVSVAIAILSIIYGIVISIINVTNLKEGGNLIMGILFIVMGIALLLYPNSLGILISLGIGIWFISSSVNRIKLAVLLRGNKDFNWLIIFLSAILTLLIGVSYIFIPLASAVALTTVGGILMIVYSICDIFEIIFLKSNIRTIENVLR